MIEVGAVAAQVRELLETVQTFQGRLFVSTVVLLLAVLWGALVIPYLLQKIQNVAGRRLLTQEMEAWVGRVTRYFPSVVGIAHLLRVVQLGLVVLVGLALLVVWGLTDLARDALAVLGEGMPLLLSAVETVVLVVVAYAAIDYLEDFVDSLAEDSETLDQHQAEVVFRVAQVSVIVLAAIMGLAVWDQDVGGLLVGAGFLGIVVGMAARQTLGSVIAGFVLMFSRPFEVGDWIAVRDHEGIVTDISIVNTRIENFDGEYVVIPNDVVSNRVVVNRTRKGRLRVSLDVGIDYSIDPERAEDAAKEAMNDLDEIMPVPRPQVVPKAFGDSSIVLELRFWIDNPSSRRQWRAKAAVVRAIYDAFDEADIKIPYPQRELSGRAETDGLRLAGQREPAAERPSGSEPRPEE